MLNHNPHEPPDHHSGLQDLRRKGKAGARVSKKRRWIGTIRPLRVMIKELRDSGKIEKAQYRKLYLRVKSGAFRSRSHLKLYLKQRGMTDENKS